jgi:zinc/manganese transport system substrate-binding protein
MTHKPQILTFSLILFFTLSSETALAKVKVVATVPDLAAIATAVAGDRAQVITLTLPTQDPHFVDARPHLALKLNRADLLLTVGLELETGWLPTLLTGARNSKIQMGNDGHLDCSTLARLKEIPRQKIDRSMGDIHPGGNPHYLTDPTNAGRIAQGIAARLTRLDGAGKAAYAKNAAHFVKQLDKARARWAAGLKPFAGTAVVPYHRSWIYFIEAMGLRAVAHLEPKPGIPPNASHVLKVIRAMRAEKVPLMLQEEYYPDRTAKLVASKTGARLLILQGGTHLRKGDSYIKRMDRMVEALLGGLKAKGR